MKKLVAFAMILSLGLFCAVGCSKPPAGTKKTETTKTEVNKSEEAKPGEKAAPADKAAPAAPAAFSRGPKPH